MEPFVIKEQEGHPALFLLDSWMKRYPYLTAGITTRTGGESAAPFCSLNCGLHVGDVPEHVVANRKRLAETLQLPFEASTYAEQIHGSEVAVVTGKEKGMGRESRETAIQAKDAMITSEKGIALHTLYADCVPLYFFDPKRQAIGMAHAGWKGSVLKIAMATVTKMANTFGSKPEDMLAAVGPSIGGCCYEVDDRVIGQVDKVLTEFEATREEKERVYHPQPEPGKYRLNLKELNRQIMIKAGILSSRIEVSTLCTSCRTDLFFSHRKEGGQTGRMAAWMAMLER
jgi:YfiH family protein